jgi:translation elongation factor EF-Tu-like GTPase
MGLHKIKTLCTTKEMVSKLKRSPRVGENICQLHIRQRTDNQNIQRAQKLNSAKINEPIKKWATELTKQNFFKRRNSNGQKAHEKMLTISGHKGNANQNHTKIPPHPC